MEKAILTLAQFKPDKNSALPLHLQLSKVLLRRIKTMPQGKDYQLPSERSLVETLKLDRSTVHRAYADLLAKNLVCRNPDKSLSVKSSARKKLQGPFPLLGLIIPEKFSDYVENRSQRSFQYIKGIFDRAAELEISVVILRMPSADATEKEIDEFIRERCEVLSGLIHLGDRGIDDDMVFSKIVKDTGFPQIFISASPSLPHIGGVSASPESGAQALAEALISRGIDRIGIIAERKTDRQKKFFQYTSYKRSDAIRRIMTAKGITVDDEYSLEVHARNFHGEILEFLEKRNGNIPEFFWCSNNVIASELIYILRNRGFRVPEDVSVAGYDGFPERVPGGEVITSIGQPFYRIGSTAVDMIMEYFDKGINDANREKTLESFFITGETLKHQ